MPSDAHPLQPFRSDAQRSGGAQLFSFGTAYHCGRPKLDAAGRDMHVHVTTDPPRDTVRIANFCNLDTVARFVCI